VSRQLIVGLAGGGVVRRKPDGSPSVDRKRGTADVSRKFANGRAERSHTDPSRGSRPPVEPECGAVGASRRFRAGAARGESGSASCRFASGGAGGRDSRLYYEIIKIETPEASVSGVFNLCGFPAISLSAHWSTHLLYAPTVKRDQSLLSLRWSRKLPNPTGSASTAAIRLDAEIFTCHPALYAEQRL